MDVLIETCTAKTFKIEIGFSDSVREIKEKIQTEQGYPISAQYLYLNGWELADDGGDASSYGILQSRSPLFLILQYNSHVEIVVRVPTLGGADDRWVRMIVGMTIPVRELKELIHDADLEDEGGDLRRPMSAGRFLLFFRGMEMGDDRELVEYGINDGSVVEAVIQPFPSPPPPSLRPPSWPLPLSVLQPRRPSTPATCANYDDGFALCEMIEATYTRVFALV